MSEGFAPPGWQPAPGEGWVREENGRLMASDWAKVDGGRVVARTGMAGWWERLASGRWVLHRVDSPEPQPVPDDLREVLNSLPEIDVRHLELIRRFGVPRRGPGGRTHDQNAAVLTAMGYRITGDALQRRYSRMRADHPAIDRLLDSWEPKRGGLPPSRIKTVVKRTGVPVTDEEGNPLWGIEDLESLAQATESGRPADRRALGKFLRAQKTSPETIESLENEEIDELKRLGRLPGQHPGDG